MSKLGTIVKKPFSKPYRKWTFLVLGVAVVAFFGVRWFINKRNALPEGIASGNGRIESKEVDVSCKQPLRVKDVLVAEGELVKPGQVVAHMDTITLEAKLAEANKNVAAAREQMAVAKAAISRRSAQIDLAKTEQARSKNLLAQRAASQREYDVRSAEVKTTTAGREEESAKYKVAEEQVKVAEANVATIQTEIDDAVLKSPVTGRVLYRLAEPGEVLGAGGKVLTLINLDDVYMEIFLPSNQAAALKVGAEARFTVDYEPDRVAAGFVSFVSPEAQFTPKEVETKSEREKLMFRVKIQIPKELVAHYIERVKTGVRGVGYVKIRDDAVWPARLDKNLIRAQPPQEVSSNR